MAQHTAFHDCDCDVLFNRTLAKLKDRFNDRQHFPSDDQMRALEDLIACLVNLSAGRTEAKLFLSSLDPGIGKTTSLITFLDTLLSIGRSPYDSVGVLICIETKQEIRALVEEAGIPETMLHVWTSDDDLNALGKAFPNDAQVLITTHSRMERLLRRKPFSECQELFFKGAPRQLRVWDEEFHYGQPISLNVDDVYWLLKALTSISRQLRDDVKRIFDEIEHVENGSLYTVPDFMRNNDVDLDDLISAVADLHPSNEDHVRLTDQQMTVLRQLAFISGRAVRVHVDGEQGPATVHYVETIPSDLAPLIVLDASGRLRLTYEGMAKCRGVLVPLKSAAKSYRNLEVYVWTRGAGKKTWKDHRKAESLISGIVSTIMTRPDEDWLVVHHRKNSKHFPDIDRMILDAVPDKLHKRVKFITWGKHRGINEYRDVPNIILAGMLYLRESQYEALKRLSDGLKPEDGTISEAELKRFQLGEHSDNILQALCRGAVRKSVGDTCPPCRAYLIASARSHIAEAIPAIFPDCKVMPWRPVKAKLSGNARRVYEYLARWAESAKPGEVLPFKFAQQALSMHRRHFKRDVRENEAFKDAVADLGLYEWGPRVYFTGWRKGI